MSVGFALISEPQIRHNLAETREMLYAFYIMFYLMFYLPSKNAHPG